MARQVSIKQVSGLLAALTARVPTSRTLTGTGGLMGGGDLSADRTISLAANLSSLHTRTGTGFAARVGTDSWGLLELTPSWGISIANGTGVGGNPLIASVHPVNTKSGDYTAVIGDGGKVLAFSALATLNLPPVATAGNGWYVMVTNTGAALVTVDAYSSEIIDGQPTLTLTPGSSTTLICDGSAWKKISGSANIAVTGLLARDSNGMFVNRSIAVASAGRLNVVNGDGVTGNPTLDLATTGTPGTYRSVTTDAYGRVTAGSNPTTLSGYGITDAQPLNTGLTAISALAPQSDRLVYYTSTTVAALATLTAFARTLIDDADAATARTTLGAAATTHNHSWAQITSGKPTTLSGYGITDALPNSGNATFTGNLTITQSLTVQNLTVEGTLTTTNQETITVTSNVIVLNQGETAAGVSAGWSGVQVDRGTLDDYFFRFDETTDRFVIGTAANLQMVATREDSPISGGIAVWNNTTNRFDTVAASTYQAATPLLASIAGLTTATDQFVYFTDVNVAAVGTVTAFARTLLDDASAGAALVTLGAAAATHNHSWAQITSGKPTTLSGYGITDAQPLDATLSAIAGVDATANTIVFFTGTDVAASTPLTTTGRSLIGGADAAAMRSTLGAAAATHTHSWSDVNTGRPTTLSGYGITDGLSTATTSAQEGYFGGLRLRDTDGSHYARLVLGTNLTAARTLTLLTGDADRSLTLAGDATLSGSNTGDQTITLSGVVTGSGTGAIVTTLSDSSIFRAKQVAYTPGGGTRNQDFSIGLSEWSATTENLTRIVVRTRAQAATDGGPANAPSTHVARFAPHATNSTVLYSSSSTDLPLADGAAAVEGETWIIKAFVARTSTLVATGYIDLIAVLNTGSNVTVGSLALAPTSAAWTAVSMNGTMPSGTVRVYASLRLANSATTAGFLFVTQVRLFPSSTDRVTGTSGGSGLNADTLQGLSPSTGATGDTVAVRDSTGGLTVAGLTASLISLTGTTSDRNTDTTFFSSDSSQLFKNTAAGMRACLGLVSGGTGDIWARRAATETISGAWSFSSTITSTRAGAGDNIYLNGTTSNWLRWNANGVAAPAFTTRSAGTKLVLADTLSSSLVDFAVGIASNTLWMSIPNSARQFQWYAGQTAIATLTGSGDLMINGSFYATTKSFQIPHPTLENHLLRHGSLEGPEFGAYCRGRTSVRRQDIARRQIRVALPAYWKALIDVDTVTVHLSVNCPHARVWWKKITEEYIEVGVDIADELAQLEEFELHWQVVGERKDTPRLVTEVPASVLSVA